MGRPPTIKNATLWVCSKCKKAVTTFVRLSEPPKCSNSGKHTPTEMRAFERE